MNTLSLESVSAMRKKGKQVGQATRQATQPTLPLYFRFSHSASVAQHFDYAETDELMLSKSQHGTPLTKLTVICSIFHI